MSMPLDPTSSPPPFPARSFWRTWRREIIRGGVLFGVVVCVGLVVSQVHVGMPVTLEQLRALKDFDIDPSGNLFGAGREIGDQWEWRGVVKPSQQVWIRNTNGPVDVVAGNGDQLEVIAEKSWRRSSPDIVQLIAVPTPQGVTVCALWKARESNCGDRGDYQQHNIRRNDVAVRFTITLPRGVRLDVSTVNGAMAIQGATAGVQASTVNGRIQLHSAAGPTKAETVNGSVEARLDAMTGGDVEIETVNGSVTAFVSAKLNALLEAETVNGRVQTELPVQLTGKISPRHVRGTIGTGGPSLKLTTVNGSITIKEAGAVTPLPDGGAPPPTPAPRAPRPPRRP
jgi:putative adhesin